MKSSSFSKEDIDEAVLRAGVSNQTSYGGCGPIAAIGILDYFARYMGYNEIMENSTDSESRIQLATEVFKNTDYSILGNQEDTLVWPWAIADAFNEVIKNHGLENIITAEADWTLFAGSKEKFLNKLKSNLKRELMQGMTLYGPHRDDFSFILENKNLKTYGSQGQQRIAIISFKLAEVSLFNEEKETSPILLLDDIFSELDIKKRNRLIKYIPDNVQTIITTTDLKNIQKRIVDNSKIFVVKNGMITEKAG